MGRGIVSIHCLEIRKIGHSKCQNRLYPEGELHIIKKGDCNILTKT